MTKQEALTLALEALERISDRFDLESVAQDATKAITVIKEALAQPEQEYDYKDLYEKEKRRAEMWLAKYEEIAGPAPKAYPLAQPDERNFCPRCGKRLASGFVEISIHTCTPPRDIK